MSNIRRHQQSGFTLIELIVVIVIIGILAAVAFPKFASLTDDAKNGVAQGAAGAASSAAIIYYAQCKGNITSSCTGGFNDCAQLNSLVSLPAGYSVTALALSQSTNQPTLCTVTDADTPRHSATFTAIGA